jgi:hypothetical protein
MAMVLDRVQRDAVYRFVVDGLSDVEEAVSCPQRSPSGGRGAPPLRPVPYGSDFA